MKTKPIPKNPLEAADVSLDGGGASHQSAGAQHAVLTTRQGVPVADDQTR